MRTRRFVEATDSVHIREVREAGFWTKGVAAIRLDGFPILLDWRTTPFGGSRAYFLCPECSERVEILYAAPHFACRRCHHLAHRSENQTPLWRKSAKLRKLRRKAAADISRLPCRIPPKSKWQRWAYLFEPSTKNPGRRSRLCGCVHAIAARRHAPIISFLSVTVDGLDAGAKGKAERKPLT
jgi:hypothetical protein